MMFSAIIMTSTCLKQSRLSFKKCFCNVSIQLSIFFDMNKGLFQSVILRIMLECAKAEQHKSSRRTSEQESNSSVSGAEFAPVARQMQRQPLRTASWNVQRLARTLMSRAHEERDWTAGASIKANSPPFSAGSGARGASPPRTPPAAQTEDAGGVEGSDMGRNQHWPV
ncbi:hypothetical protein DPX16_1434 [Anabarilius grahami]|uniref:Uncharacterized protein n=1 Tax=Anabarilius grahami TaxID=495550 RepID=A0A3N0YKV8_ANAGA|nr:hypothetical protein DPX16_1434 [Anabarilius grahami]